MSQNRSTAPSLDIEDVRKALVLSIDDWADTTPEGFAPHEVSCFSVALGSDGWPIVTHQSSTPCLDDERTPFVASFLTDDIEDVLVPERWVEMEAVEDGSTCVRCWNDVVEMRDGKAVGCDHCEDCHSIQDGCL